MSQNANGMKVCKYCQSEIPKKAKVCPQCRKKQGGGIVKWIVIILAVFFIVSSVIGGDEKEEIIGEESSKIVVDNKTTEENIGESVEVIEYFYENTIGDTLLFIAIKNNASYAISANINAVALDENGIKLGADDGTINVIGAGEETVECLYFDSVSGIKSFDYEIEYEKENYFNPAMSYIEIEEVINEKNVVITCTNNHDEKSAMIEAYVLFLNDGEVKNYGSAYFTDDDFELKAGKSISEQIDCYGNFNEVKIFYEGYLN